MRVLEVLINNRNNLHTHIPFNTMSILVLSFPLGLRLWSFKQEPCIQRFKCRQVMCEIALTTDVYTSRRHLYQSLLHILRWALSLFNQVLVFDKDAAMDLVGLGQDLKTVNKNAKYIGCCMHVVAWWTVGDATILSAIIVLCVFRSGFINSNWGILIAVLSAVFISCYLVSEKA